MGDLVLIQSRRSTFRTREDLLNTTHTDIFILTQFSYTRSSDGAPHPDGVLKNTVRPKILNYRRLYADLPDPIVFMSLTVNSSDHLYQTMCVVVVIQESCKHADHVIL